MSARRLGADIDQSALAESPHFTPERVSQNGQLKIPGGFDDKGLTNALNEVAPIPGRVWIGGEIPEDLSTPATLLKHLKGYLKSTQASIILRVKGTQHWIVIDSVTPNDRFVIRDPADSMSSIVTPEQLHAWRPNGQAVLSFPEKRK